MAGKTVSVVYQRAERRRPACWEYRHFDDDYTKTMLEIYAAYETECERGAIDFGEILAAHELWLKNPQILQHYQQGFSMSWSMSSDTNTIQYAWLRSDRQQ